jgi:exportin-1
MFPLQLSLAWANSCSVQITQFIEGLFIYQSDLVKFKTNLRDFLIGLKEFSGDNAELFTEDRELEQQAVKDAELERLKRVGGLLKPADLDQDDEL